MLDQTMIYSKYFDFAMICLLLSVNVPSTSSVSCENMVRLADLQDIIKNQTKLIRDQRQVNDDQRKVVEDQQKLIENQTRFIGDVQRKLQYVTTGKI